MPDVNRDCLFSFLVSYVVCNLKPYQLNFISFTSVGLHSFLLDLCAWLSFFLFLHDIIGLPNIKTYNLPSIPACMSPSSSWRPLITCPILTWRSLYMPFYFPLYFLVSSCSVCFLFYLPIYLYAFLFTIPTQTYLRQPADHPSLPIFFLILPSHSFLPTRLLSWFPVWLLAFLTSCVWGKGREEEMEKWGGRLPNEF